MSVLVFVIVVVVVVKDPWMVVRGSTGSAGGDETVSVPRQQFLDVGRAVLGEWGDYPAEGVEELDEAGGLLVG